MNTTDRVELLLRQKPEKRVFSIGPEQTVYAALELMAAHNLGAVPVLAEGRLAGIFSERDYARKGILLGHASRRTKVREMMTTPVHYVTPVRTVDECMALMTEHRIRHLPVLDGLNVVGLVSIGDLVKWVITGQELTIQALEGFITGAYPA
jgi:CBS domain-containing protein